MTYHTVQISDETYQLLLRQARGLQTTPEALLEQLAHELDVLHDKAYADEAALDEPEATIEALAAVKRLTNLFAAEFVTEQPKTISGKIRRVELRERERQKQQSG